MNRRTFSPAQSPMSKDGMGEETGGNTVPVGTDIDGTIWTLGEVEVQPKRMKAGTIGTQSSESFSSSEDQEQQLLPGLPDEFTLEQIVPKLPWRSFHVLASVSRSWRKVIQSFEVYDARVRSKSTETHVVLNYKHWKDSAYVQAIALYSMREKTFHKLPPLPLFDGGVPLECVCMPLGGKIYVLGGGEVDWGSSEVHVLDLAGRREWKQCASMKEPRKRFGCGVKDGKIYVFGGLSRGKYIRNCEVYDPELDAWSSVRPMKHEGFSQQVTILGEEIFVEGEPVDPDGAFFWAVYHPGKDEWRSVERFDYTGERKLFTARGRLYSLDPDGIILVSSGLFGHFEHCDEDTWSDLHSFLFDGAGPTDPVHSLVHVTCAVNDEVLALVDWAFDEDSNDLETWQTWLLRGRGFGRENEEIVWEKVNCTLFFGHLVRCIMCPVEL